MTDITNRKKMFLVSSYENWSDPYFLKKIKKIKMLDECNVKLDAVFAKNFNKFPIVDKYCLNHNVETISLEKDEQNYFFSIVRYAHANPDKKNLAALASERIAINLDFLFKQDPSFYSYLVR